MKGKIIMSCNNSNIRNIDTSIYTQSTGCSTSNTPSVQIIERAVPCYIFPPQPPIFPPPAPPAPIPTPNPNPTPTPTPTNPTASYAEFYNNSATGATYTAGENIPFPTTLYNTDTAGIVNNNGILTLSGGANGSTYLISYQVTGTNTNAVLGLAINSTVDTNTQVIQGVTGDTTAATTSGSYIVSVPANTTSTVAVRVVSGTIAGASPTVGTHLSVVKLA